MSKKKIRASAGRPYGHVPGHYYLDVDIECRRTTGGRWYATILVRHGADQGAYDQEHGRDEYAASGLDAIDAIETVRCRALGATKCAETRRYIETACARAIAAATGGSAETAA